MQSFTLVILKFNIADIAYVCKVRLLFDFKVRYRAKNAMVTIGQVFIYFETSTRLSLNPVTRKKRWVRAIDESTTDP
jgi:hypothetical protein